MTRQPMNRTLHRTERLAVVTLGSVARWRRAGIGIVLLAFFAAPLVRADGGLAFPGAQGWAARTPGGRGGDIVRVTTLASNGPGSFAAAVQASGRRVVVFEVGGVIDLGKVPKDDPSLSPMQLWCNESQERYVLGIPPSRVERLDQPGVSEKRMSRPHRVGCAASSPETGSMRARYQETPAR